MYHSIFYYYTCISLLQLPVPTLYVMVTDVYSTVRRKYTDEQTAHLENSFRVRPSFTTEEKEIIVSAMELTEQQECGYERTHSLPRSLHRSITHSPLPASLPLAPRSLLRPLRPSLAPSSLLPSLPPTPVHSLTLSRPCTPHMHIQL